MAIQPEPVHVQHEFNLVYLDIAGANASISIHSYPKTPANLTYEKGNQLINNNDPFSAARKYLECVSKKRYQVKRINSIPITRLAWILNSMQKKFA